MSHKPERQEKNCLNCGTIVYGRYCHVCGQENVVPKETFWSLLQHFIEDMTHFDNKFFDTLKYILFRPGHISKQYTLGKRASFLNPIRMYLFTSAIFFLIFFSLINPENVVRVNQDEKRLTKEERAELMKDFQEELNESPGDTSLKRRIALLLDTSKAISSADVGAENGYIISGKGYKSRSEYDSIQKTLSPEKKDDWLERQAIRKGLDLDTRYKGNTKAMVKDFGNAILHRLPYLLFVSLPFFALLLKLIYIRRKHFYYSDHAIFTLYHYIFSFILLLLIFGLRALKEWLHWGIFNFLTFLLILVWPTYLIIAMKKFYGQSRGKTFAKFLLLNFLAFVVILFLFLVFVFFSIYQL